MKNRVFLLFLPFVALFYGCFSTSEPDDVFGEFNGVYLKFSNEDAVFYAGDTIPISLTLNSDFSDYERYVFNLSVFVSSSNDSNASVSVLASADSESDLSELTVSFLGEREDFFSSPVLRKKLYLKVNSDSSGYCTVKIHGKAFRKNSLDVDLCERKMFFDFSKKEE